MGIYSEISGYKYIYIYIVLFVHIIRTVYEKVCFCCIYNVVQVVCSIVYI